MTKGKTKARDKNTVPIYKFVLVYTEYTQKHSKPKNKIQVKICLNQIFYFFNYWISTSKDPKISPKGSLKIKKCY